MKKSLLALAVLGVFAGTALAQSSVTLFGTVDVSMESVTTKSAAGVSLTDKRLGNNRQGTSQLSVRGVEDLGGGLTALFLWEGDFDATQQATNHQAGAQGGEVYVGLNGRFGKFLMGSPNSPTLIAQANRQPFGTKLGSGFSPSGGSRGEELGSLQVRQNNAIRYDTPNFGGFVASIDAADANSNPTKGRVYDLGLTYASGPLQAFLTYYKATNGNDKLVTLTGSYNFGPAIVMVGFHKETASYIPSAAGGLNGSSNGANIGAKILVSGNLNLLFNYAKLDDKSALNNDRRIVAFGPQYVLSARSTIYGRYVRETVDNLPVASAINKSTTAWLMGLQHNF